MIIISDIIKKTKEMDEYEEETGKKAIWRNKVTESFKKWQKGEKNYNLNKDRISLYLPEGLKDEWIDFAENNNYSTLSKLIRRAVKFYIEHHFQYFDGMNDLDIDYMTKLSHDLKDPLTSLKAYLQLIIEDYKEFFEENVLNILTNAFNQCLTLESTITEKLDKKRLEKGNITKESKTECDILLIEDDIEIVKFLKNYFSSKGYICITATNGTEGLEKLKSYDSKLCLLDIILPDISGYEIIKEIRKDETTKKLPIFFFTAIPREEALKKVEEYGITGLISKPFNLKDFQLIYDYLLDK